MKVLLLILLPLITLKAACATTIQQNFEAVSANYFEPLRGKASEGSTLEISTERAHSATHAVKIAYKFSGLGYLTPHVTQRPVVANADGKLYFSLWVYGSGQNDSPAHACD
jgi:hypothetical protein